MRGAVSFLAILLYVLPPIWWALSRQKGAKRDNGESSTPWDSWLATGFALDLLIVLTVARVLTLEKAVWAVRTAEVAALLVLTRGTLGLRHAWLALRQGLLAGPLTSALVALAFSLALSVPCGLWDRSWHIPLVGSLRAERTPFLSVFDSGLPLYYHYGGDVVAAMLQVLSCNHMHAATALARSHDILFVVFGLLVGSLVSRRGHWAWAPVLTLLVLLAGPAWVGPIPEKTSGLLEALTSVLSYSFRPSAPLGLLFGLAFCAALFDRGRHALLTVVILAAGLVLSDEVALATGGLVAGAMTCVHREPFGVPRRTMWVRLAVTGGMVLAVPLLLGGALSWGAAREALALARGHAPGFYDQAFPLWSGMGARRVLALFLCPVMAGALALARWREAEVVERQALTFFLGVLALSCLVVLILHLGPEGAETVRFATLPQVLTPFVVSSCWRTGRSPRKWPMVVGSLALVLPLASTVRWLFNETPGECGRATAATSPALYHLDCRESASSRFGEEPPRRTIAELEDFFLFAGCRPSLAVGRAGPQFHQISTTGPETGREALVQLRTHLQTALSANEPVRLVCRERPSPNESLFCRKLASANLPCVSEGDWKICDADQKARETLEPLLTVSRPMPKGHLRARQSAASSGSTSAGASGP